MLGRGVTPGRPEEVFFSLLSTQRLIEYNCVKEANKNND